MKHVEFKPKGICARSITFDIFDDQTIHNVKYEGGCNGNLKGLSALVEGQLIDNVINILQGIDCHGKGTSCPDQLAQAILQNR